MLGEEVLTTMAKEPAVRINEGMCLENAPLEEIKLGTGNTDSSRKRVRQRFLNLMIKIVGVYN